VVLTFGVLALCAVSVQVVVLALLHRLPTGYNFVRDAISDYGVGRYRSYFAVQLFAGALACACIAVAFTQLHPYAPTFVAAALFVNAAARFLMPAFPTDQSGGRFKTVKGTIHMVLAIVAFAAVAAAATSLSGLLSHYQDWHNAKEFFDTLGWVVLVGAIATALALVGPRLKQIFGLIERLFTLSVIIWLYAVAIELVRFAR
jgi:hypothetical protein